MEIQQLIAMSLVVGFVTGWLHRLEDLVSGGIKLIPLMLTLIAIVIVWLWLFSFDGQPERLFTAAVGVIAGGLIAQLVTRARARRGHSAVATPSISETPSE